MDVIPDVRILELPPLRVASFTAYSSSPEGEAWRKMVTWAEDQGVLTYPHGQRIFGFNNPGPTPGNPNYGYEFWLTVGPEVQGEGEVEIKDFPGGMYAVARCEDLAVIGQRWQELVQWQQASGYREGRHQWLEEHLEPVEIGPQVDEASLVLDLFLPIHG
jgi:DNA gyrase inhibitor GyrI